MRIVTKLWYFLLVALVSQPIVMLIALITTAFELKYGASSLIIIWSIVGILLFTPLMLLIVFGSLYFNTTKNVLISFEEVADEVVIQKYQLYFAKKIKLKNVLKLFWINLKEVHAQGYSYFEGFEIAKMNMIEFDLRAYLARKIKEHYGLDAHDAFNRVGYNKIDIELY